MDTPDQVEAQRCWSSACEIEQELQFLRRAPTNAATADDKGPVTLFQLEAPEGVYQIATDRTGVERAYEVYTSIPDTSDGYDCYRRGAFLFRFAADPADEVDRFKKAVQRVEQDLKAPLGLSFEKEWEWRRARIQKIVEDKTNRQDS